MNISLWNCLKSGLFVFHRGYFRNVKYSSMVALLLPAAVMWDWMKCFRRFLKQSETQCRSSQADVRSRFPTSQLTSRQPDVNQLLPAWKTLNLCDPRTSSWDVAPPLLRRHRGKWWRRAVTVIVPSVHLRLTRPPLHVSRSIRTFVPVAPEERCEEKTSNYSWQMHKEAKSVGYQLEC